jgi:3',5'-cyclic AMP phosphodiesterase CpdA
MLTLAHLSDIHLGPMPRPRLQDLTPKRLTGLANWHQGRKHRHRPEVLETLLEDIRQQTPSHIVVTGDLCNVGMPEEFAEALKWLERLGPPDRVTVIPGNHDAYVRLRRDPGIARWEAYMAGEAPGAVRRRGETVSFPFVRRLDRVALIGLSSAVPTRMFQATGQLGGAQRQAAAELLSKLGAEGLTRVVLIHHPPLPTQSPRTHCLIDAGDFAALLRRAGAELVLHGHSHRAMLAHAEGPRGNVPVVGVPSASHAGRHRHHDAARYNLYRIDARGGDTRISMVGRAITSDLTRMTTVEERVLTP